jgi:hypothetical protein
MMLPQQYHWLPAVQPPRMIVEALNLYGTIETPGAGNNPTIMAWAKETGLTAIYSADSVPWCGLLMAWAKFGVEAGQPRLGDVLTFTRKGGGHVGLYVGEDKAAYHVLGGNQGDAVSITRIGKERLYRARRPAYSQIPASVQPIVLAASGTLSENEA